MRARRRNLGSHQCAGRAISATTSVQPAPGATVVRDLATLAAPYRRQVALRAGRGVMAAVVDLWAVVAFRIVVALLVGLRGNGGTWWQQRSRADGATSTTRTWTVCVDPAVCPRLARLVLPNRAGGSRAGTPPSASAVSEGQVMRAKTARFRFWSGALCPGRRTDEDVVGFAAGQIATRDHGDGWSAGSPPQRPRPSPACSGCATSGPPPSHPA